MSWHYPLIQLVREMYRTADMSDVLLLACQHLLGSQYQMFTSLMKLGLKPENCVVIGKNYSTNNVVHQKLVRCGCSVAPWSNQFVCDEAFDGWFERNLESFVVSELEKRNLEQYRQIVVLDDGGFLHGVCGRHLGHHQNVHGVEQTTSGDTRIRGLNLSYEVLSIARSYLKQRLEAPHIGELAYERTVEHFKKRGKKNPRILVLGLGTIGRQVAGRLYKFGKYEAYGCDLNLDKVARFGLVQILRNEKRILKDHDNIADFDVVIGATGSQLFDEAFIESLHQEVSLISLSSSDREFPAMGFRRSVQGGIHDDYYLGGRCLVNAGFPITFYGNYDEVAPKKIELTVAVLMAGVLNSVQSEEGYCAFPIAAARLADAWHPN